MPDGVVDEIITLDRRQFNGSAAFFRPATLRQIYSLRQRPYDAVVFFHHFTLKAGTLKFAFIAWASGAKRIIGLDNGNGWFLNERLADDGFGARHQAQYWLALVALLGADSAARRASVAFDNGVLPLPATSQKRVVIHTGSGGYSAARRWLPGHFAQVADALHATHNAQIVFVGTPADGADDVIRQMKHRPVNLAGRTSLTQLADVIRSADLYIGADSGVMHLAAAVRTPVIAVFGSSNPLAWGPWSPNGVTAVLRSGPLCSPCSYTGHSIGAREGCAARTCMAMVTPETVLKAAQALLNEEPFIAAPTPAYPRSPLGQTAFGGLPHHRGTTAQFIAAIGEMIAQPHQHLVLLSDYARVLQARSHPILRSIYQRAALVIPCGAGLSWASSWQQRDLPERVDALVIIGSLLETAQAKGWRVTLVGAHAAAAAQALAGAGIRIHHAVTLPDAAAEEDAAVQQINAGSSDLVLVGWEAGSADLWLARNLPRLRGQVFIAIGEDMLREMAGKTPAVPEFLQDLRLGWAYLALRQPRRLRALWQAPRFVAHTVLGQ
jgi:heptosyltransferase-2